MNLMLHRKVCDLVITGFCLFIGTSITHLSLDYILLCNFPYEVEMCMLIWYDNYRLQVERWTKQPILKLRLHD